MRDDAWLYMAGVSYASDGDYDLCETRDVINLRSFLQYSTSAIGSTNSY